MNSTNRQRRTPQETQAIVEKSLNRRYWAERRFRYYGMAAVTAGMTFLVYLFFVIFSNGIGAFRQTQIRLPVFFDPAIIAPEGDRSLDALHAVDYTALIRASLKAKFPQVEGRVATRELMRLVSGSAAFDLQQMVIGDPKIMAAARNLAWPVMRGLL